MLQIILSVRKRKSSDRKGGLSSQRGGKSIVHGEEGPRGPQRLWDSALRGQLKEGPKVPPAWSSERSTEAVYTEK